MQRSNKKSALTAGYLFDASLEGFATVRQTLRKKFYFDQSVIKKVFIFITAHEYVHVLRYGPSIPESVTTKIIVI